MRFSFSGGFFTSRQLPIGDPLPGGGADETIQAVQGVALHVPIVEAEGEFVDVAPQVLRAGLVVDAMNAPLHHGKDALDAVGCDIAPGVLPGAVIDALMAEEQPVQAIEDGRFICVKGRAKGDLGMDGPHGGIQVHSGHGEGNRPAPALPHAEHGRLTYRAAPGFEFFSIVLVPLLPAEIGVVNLDHALQLGQIVPARLPEPMKDEPRGLLGDSDFLAQLHGGDALAGRDEQIHGVEPLMERDVAPLENRARPDGEILPTGVASVVAALADRNPLAAGTDGALDPVRPEAGFEVEPGRFLIGEHLKKLEG